MNNAKIRCQLEAILQLDSSEQLIALITLTDELKKAAFKAGLKAGMKL